MRRPLGFFILAGTAAMLAALVVYSALQRREAELMRAKLGTTEIVVAARALPLGSKLEPDSVKLARWPRETLPAGAFTDTQAVMNAYAKSTFVENEPIVADKLFMGQKTAGVLPLLIPAGMRAMSVPVDEVSDIAGFVLPHSHVDILVAIDRSGNGADKAFSKLVLENVEVLAVAQEIEGTKDKPQVVRVVTLLVTPEEAERLALASRQGTLRLAMRNYSDDKIVLTHGADVTHLLSVYTLQPPPTITAQSVGFRRHRAPSAAPRQNRMDIDILRNGKSSESVSFIQASLTGLGSEPAPDSSPAAPGAPRTGDASGKTKLARSATTKARRTASGRHLIHASLARAEGASVTKVSASAPEAGYMPKPKTLDIP